jgi:hypothetical protein
MMKSQIRQNCPKCRQESGVDIIYRDVDELDEALRNALQDGTIVLGGTSRKWDWEEELIDTRCVRCGHEWHSWHKNLVEPSQAGSMPFPSQVNGGSAGQANSWRASWLSGRKDFLPLGRG